jgi:hypothetical protein
MRIRQILSLALTMLPTLTWLLFSMAVIMRGPLCNCPKCGSKRIRRSRRGIAGRLLPAFFVRRRCELCRTRFFNLESVNYHRATVPSRGQWRTLTMFENADSPRSSIAHTR